MKKWLRRIRAAIGMGLIWAAAWLGAGLILLAIVGLHAADVPFPLFFGLLGFLAGAVFSGVLGVLGRKRRFDQMSFPRFAGWGALGGALLAGAFAVLAAPDVQFLVVGPVLAIAGAISATGTLALARKANAGELRGGGGEAGMVGRGSDEVRELPGGGG